MLLLHGSRNKKAGVVSMLLLLMISTAICTTSCQGEKSSKPAQPAVLLNDQQMISILLDIHLVEGALNFKRNIGQSMEDQKNEYFEELFRQHGITQNLFQENLLYYNQIPHKMDVIYDSVTRRLEVMQGRLELEKSASTAE